MSEDTIAEALAADHDLACSLVAKLSGATELDRYCRLYNVNDGAGPLHGVLQHPECDAGTALYVYWEFHELLHDAELRVATSSEAARWNIDALLSEIERRYPHDFPTAGIMCEPQRECARAFGIDYVEAICARHRGSALMQPHLTDASAA